jgi:hypothetical protein
LKNKILLCLIASFLINHRNDSFPSFDKDKIMEYAVPIKIVASLICGTLSLYIIKRMFSRNISVSKTKCFTVNGKISSNKAAYYISEEDKVAVSLLKNGTLWNDFKESSLGQCFKSFKDYIKYSGFGQSVKGVKDYVKNSGFGQCMKGCKDYVKNSGPVQYIACSPVVQCL